MDYKNYQPFYTKHGMITIHQFIDHLIYNINIINGSWTIYQHVYIFYGYNTH